MVLSILRAISSGASEKREWGRRLDAAYSSRGSLVLALAIWHAAIVTSGFLYKKKSLAALLALGLASAAPPAKPFESISGCVLQADEWTDGDSFRLKLPDGRLQTFRLYFVDTTESRPQADRSEEQAAYFGITREQSVALGKEALVFTRSALSKPFTVHTRWRSLFGVRWLGLVTTSTGDDLGELLVRNGLARIYGVRTPLPDGRTSREYLTRLKEVEAEAKAKRLGGWRFRVESRRPRSGAGLLLPQPSIMSLNRCRDTTNQITGAAVGARGF